MESKHASTSQIETAYERLRSALVTGQVGPGSKLKINNLALELDVSPGAVRESLARLSVEGLVKAEPQRGFWATPMSMAELQDITRVRIEIETLCLRRSIELGDVQWESGVVGAYHALQRAPVDPKQRHAAPTRPWATAHEQFHNALVAACDSPWLLKLRELVFLQSERYRLASIGFIPQDRPLEDEHKNLFDAVLARDGREACALIDRHFSETAEQLRKQGRELLT